MTHNYTELLLVKYLYNETNEQEQLEIESMLKLDSELRENLEMLAKRKALLPDVLFSPPTETINNILGYSQQNALEAHF